MSTFITGTQYNKSKIHYIEVVNGKIDNMANCSAIGPFEQIKITYRDRQEGRVCKKCFKDYISSLTVRTPEEIEET